MKKKWVVAVLVVLGVVASGLWLARGEIKKQFFKPTQSNVPIGVSKQDTGQSIEELAMGLTVPWSVVVLPDDQLLVTERSGSLRRVGTNNQSYKIEGVEHIGEGGLLGIALDPNFKQNNQIYLYMTTKTGDSLTNRIEKYTYNSDKLTDKKLLLSGIPGANYHDGGRMAFGPDGFLYVTTGDAGNTESAQDKNSLAGKILRITTDGKPAPGNPFGNTVYSYGHRNPQGLAWDDQGRLWSSEHGRTSMDEINLIKSGGNYGWPVIQGDEEQVGMTRPVLHSGASDTWAPASLTYVDGSLFFGGLRGQALFQAKIISESTLELKAHFKSQYGRIREANAFGEYLFITTSNTDGRGAKKAGDDRLIKIKLDLFAIP